MLNPLLDCGFAVFQVLIPKLSLKNISKSRIILLLWALDKRLLCMFIMISLGHLVLEHL